MIALSSKHQYHMITGCNWSSKITNLILLPSHQPTYFVASSMDPIYISYCQTKLITDMLFHFPFFNQSEIFSLTNSTNHCCQQSLFLLINFSATEGATHCKQCLTFLKEQTKLGRKERNVNVSYICCNLLTGCYFLVLYWSFDNAMEAEEDNLTRQVK